MLSRFEELQLILTPLYSELNGLLGMCDEHSHSLSLYNQEKHLTAAVTETGYRITTAEQNIFDCTCAEAVRIAFLMYFSQEAEKLTVKM